MSLYPDDAIADLRLRVEALESRLPLNSRVDPPGCPACNGVAGTACRCAEPVPECCTDGTCPTCAPLMAWADYRKDYEPRDSAPEPDPEPVPEWRALVNEVKLPRDLHPLAAVLYDLHCLDVFPRAKKSLARIVAVAEREVGDGWQVDPDLIRMCHPDRRDRCDLDCLIDALTKDGESRWTVLGGRTAAWLKAITEDEAS